MQLNKNYDQARYNLGLAYIENKQAGLAIKQFKILLTKHPRNIDYACALADAQREDTQWEKAIKSYQKILLIKMIVVCVHTLIWGH